MLFKLLRGYHKDWTYRTDAEGRRQTSSQRLYKPGETVESDRDLAKLFNHPGSIKFERLPDPPQSTAQPAVAVAERPDVDLDSMTLRDLQALAETEEIDLGGAKTKDQMVKVIRQALG